MPCLPNWLRRSVLAPAVAASTVAATVMAPPAVILPTLSIAYSQTPAETTRTTPTLLRGGEVGELLTVYVPRSESEIQRQLDSAREMQASVSKEIDDARRLATEADGRVKIMEQELQTTKVRRDVAKKGKDPTAAQLEDGIKRQERERNYLEDLRDVMRADADRIEADRSAATARVKSLELELEAARKYVEVSAPGASPKSVGEYRSLLRELLDAQRDSAEKWGEAAGKRKLVAERRIRQLQALSKLVN